MSQKAQSPSLDSRGPNQIPKRTENTLKIKNLSLARFHSPKFVRQSIPSIVGLIDIPGGQIFQP